MSHKNAGSANPNWKGGKPICLCGKKLAAYSSRKCLQCHVKSISGTKNYGWKEKPSYKTIHRWIERKFIKPNLCDFCKTNPGPGKDGRTKLHWANKDRQYLRDRDNWYCLCASCHKKYDMNSKINSSKGSSQY